MPAVVVVVVVVVAVKMHVHFPHESGTYFTIDTLHLLWLKLNRLLQGDRETSVNRTSGLSAVRGLRVCLDFRAT